MKVNLKEMKGKKKEIKEDYMKQNKTETPLLLRHHRTQALAHGI